MENEKKLTILVADDTPQILKMIEMRLKLSGHTIITAVNGREAVEKASKHKPELILLDIMMPDLNGLEALINIKKFAPNTPIAMVSASTANEHLKEALNRGAIGYINKPVDFKQLDALITEVLQKFKMDAIQEKLDKMSQMAALGEISAKVATEVTQPIKDISNRIIEMAKEADKNRDERLKVVQNILQGWKRKYVLGEFVEYLDTKIPNHQEGFTNAQEDFNNLDILMYEILEVESNRLAELDFLQKQLDFIMQNIDSLSRLGRQSENLQKVDVNEILQDTKEVLQDKLWKRGIQIVETFSPSLPKVLADPNELLQVFKNVTENAADAIEMLPSEVSTSRKIISYDTSYMEGNAEIRISDRGIGIPEAYWETIFESTYTTKRNRSKSTGLGLSIARKFIKSYGGDIRVESSISGQGTYMLIWIPVPEDEKPKQLIHVYQP